MSSPPAEPSSGRSGVGSAPVALIYHDILPADDADPDAVGFSGPLARRYKLTRSAFEAHLTEIAHTGVPVTRYDRSASGRSLLLTFDDGGASAPLSAELLATRGWVGHFFVTTSRIGSPGFVDADGIRALAEAGHVVGSHSHTHPAYMRDLDFAALLAEWQTSRDVLGQVLGTPPAVAAVPGGSLSAAVLEAVAQAGYGTVMTSEPRRRRRRQGALEVIDRYTVWTSTPASQVRGYVAQTAAARWRSLAEWELKKALKRASPALYQRGRKMRARV